jgi:hypothetical protein
MLAQIRKKKQQTFTIKILDTIIIIIIFPLTIYNIKSIFNALPVRRPMLRYSKARTKKENLHKKTS